MFKYGLLGNIATYGGIVAVFGYIAYEMNQIAERSPHISEELAREVLDPAKAPKISLDQKEDMRKIAAKLYQEDYQRKKHEPKERVEIVEQVQKKKQQQTTNKDSYM